VQGTGFIVMITISALHNILW